MDDVLVEPGPGAPRGLVIPENELFEVFSHSGGPGGQGVNTSDSRVQLSLDLGTTTALDEEQRALVLEHLSPRLFGSMLTITASEFRSQRRNRAAARDRLAELLREAVVPPVKRRLTKPTRGSKARRSKAKEIRSEVKQNRRRPLAE